MKTTVDFLRHGEAAGGSYYRGITDDPLTELGWQQMQQAVSKKSWDQLISSPLQRCATFSQSLHQQSSTPLLIDEHWQEYNFGDWEGKRAIQIADDALGNFYRDPVQHAPASAEQYSTFVARVDLAWSGLINDYQGKHILVVTHGGIIRTLFHILLNISVNNSFKIQINHAGMTRFECFHEHNNDYVSLIFHNLTPSHLYLSL